MASGYSPTECTRTFHGVFVTCCAHDTWVWLQTVVTCLRGHDEKISSFMKLWSCESVKLWDECPEFLFSICVCVQYSNTPNLFSFPGICVLFQCLWASSVLVSCSCFERNRQTVVSLRVGCCCFFFCCSFMIETNENLYDTWKLYFHHQKQKPTFAALCPTVTNVHLCTSNSEYLSQPRQ